MSNFHIRFEIYTLCEDSVFIDTPCRISLRTQTSFPTLRGRGSISKVEGHWPKGALLYMTKMKRFHFVHEPNENFWKYGISITSEMAFTESLLLQKGHFLSRKRGRSFKKYFFRPLNGAFKPRKKGNFFTFKNSGWGGHMTPLPPPRSGAPAHTHSLLGK
jgi:hypothetical protein